MAHERPLRVAHVIYGLVLGGLEQVVLELAVRGREHGVEPLILSFGEQGPLGEVARARGVPLQWLGDVPGLSPRSLVPLARAIGGFRADLVHAHDLGPWLNAAVVRLLRPQARLLATFHQLLRPKGAQVGLAKVAARASVALVACGAEVGRDVRAWAPRSARVVTIGNGVPFPESLDPCARSAARRSLGIPEGALAFGYLGRMHEEKGPDLVLELFLSRFRGRPDVHLALIGGGPLLPALRARAAGQTNVHVAGEVTDGAARLLQGLDIYVQGSRREGRSLSMLEAMAAALPTVARRLPAIEEIHGPDTALLTEPDDPGAFTAAMGRLVDDPALRRRMGAAARARVRRHSVGAMVARYAALYRAPGALA